MRKYECDFYVNGKRTKQVVIAMSASAAKDLIKSQYPTSNISWAGFPKDMGVA